jgi:hypothetical protein
MNFLISTLSASGHLLVSAYYKNKNVVEISMKILSLKSALRRKLISRFYAIC